MPLSRGAQQKVGNNTLENFGLFNFQERWYQAVGFAQEYEQIKPLLARYAIPTPELPLDHQNLHRPWHLIKDSIKKIEKINHRQLLHQHANLPYLL